MSCPQLQRNLSLSSASEYSSTSHMNVDTDVEAQTTISKASEPKRTRKRFSQEQLIILEQAYHRATHPTRGEREGLAKQADMSFKSVTIWFQNKRQAERKSALNSESDRKAPTPLAMYPSSNSVAPFIDSVSARSSSQPSTRSQSVTRLLPRTASGFISLDRIASRSERPPCTPTKLTRHSSFYETRPRSPVALWDSMLSSPIQPEKDGNDNDMTESPSARDYLAFASARETDGAPLKGRRTLEWACAAARMSVDRDDGEFDADFGEPVPKLLFSGDNDLTTTDDDDGTEILDTEMESIEDSHEAITPDHSQFMFPDHPSPTLKASQLNFREFTPEEKKPVNAATDVDKRIIENDTEILDAAWVLCGLSSQRR